MFNHEAEYSWPLIYEHSCYKPLALILKRSFCSCCDIRLFAPLWRVSIRVLPVIICTPEPVYKM